MTLYYLVSRTVEICSTNECMIAKDQEEDEVTSNSLSSNISLYVNPNDPFIKKKKKNVELIEHLNWELNIKSTLVLLELGDKDTWLRSGYK
nr:hypothetical protein Itr_chr02CG19130 [Ipomoea trifida]